jgi:isoamylase
MGRTQGGNNNAYCQDNEISWIDWQLDEPRRALLAFARYVIELRREHPVFHRRRFFQGRRIRGGDVEDLAWFEPSGREMSDDAWNSDAARALMVRLGGTAMDEVDTRGADVVDDTFALLLNANAHGMMFTLPTHRTDVIWQLLLDTSKARQQPRPLRGARYRLWGRSLAVLRTQPRED